MNDSKLLSVVVPVFNEEENLTLLYERTSAVLQELQTEWELILVDDGSTD
ncbi:MAG: glycosyltransferase, partial [Candidatus Hydrogenedentes bacterium]|nr:glycosyltransferase [Candidatus Hydrogenedentota bacterium]